MSKPMVIRGGRVIDPRNRVDGVRDVRLEDGKVAARLRAARSRSTAPRRCRPRASG